MHLNILITIVIICATLHVLEINALKRIKRQFNSKTHSKRLKDDFIMLPNEKPDHLEAAKDNLKLARYETFSAVAPYSDNSENLVTDANKKRNASRPLVEILRQGEHQLTENQKKDLKAQTADLESRALKINAEKAPTLSNKRCNTNSIVEEFSKHHKNKHVPHSAGIFEAKIVIPSQHIKTGFDAFGSMNLNNMIMYKVGMDSLSSNYFYPKMLLAENSPSVFEEDTLNEPPLNYLFNSFGAPKGHNFYRHALKQSNSPIVDNGWQAHAIFSAPPSSSLMQNALDALLANREDTEGDKSEQQIEIRCPMHQDKEGTEQIEGDKADVIQVCSCRLIKKAKDDDVKKSK